MATGSSTEARIGTTLPSKKRKATSVAKELRAMESVQFANDEPFERLNPSSTARPRNKLSSHGVRMAQLVQKKKAKASFNNGASLHALSDNTNNVIRRKESRDVNHASSRDHSRSSSLSRQRDAIGSVQEANLNFVKGDIRQDFHHFLQTSVCFGPTRLRTTKLVDCVRCQCHTARVV